MGIIENELNSIYRGRVKTKSNQTKKIQKPNNNSKGKNKKTPSEVMVKITGFSKGATGVKANIDYISRNGQVELETNDGELLTSYDEIKDYFQEWKHDINSQKKRSNGRDSMHLVLSMPAGTEPEAVKAAAREFGQKNFASNYDYVFALHDGSEDKNKKTDPNPHVHFNIKCMGYDGRKINPKRDDIQQWREDFAAALEKQGVEALATPRVTRGVVKKGYKAKFRHMENDNRVPKVKAMQTNEAVKEILNENKGKKAEKPLWRTKLEERNAAVKNSWGKIADELDKTNPEQAKEVRAFIKSMPNVETQKDALKKQLRNQFKSKNAQQEVNKAENAKAKATDHDLEK